MQTLTLTRPDDMHLHLRDGAALASVLPDSARQFARAIIMPNLIPPVATLEAALAYRERIRAALPAGSDFQPLMTLYLTEKTQPEDIARAKASGQVHAVKYYPAGATTNSESGVMKMENVYPVLAAMEKHDLPLLIHGEVTAADIDIFDREAVFIERVLSPLLQQFCSLRMVMEHISTREAVELVLSGPDNLAATVTPQHLLLNRNALLAGGLRPHHYCLPVLKAEADRQAVVEAAVSGHPRIFLGSDSAPHARHDKQSDCGCAGIYSAHNALELYAEVFATAGRLEQLEAFASFNGADFYQLPRNTGTVTLEKSAWIVPETLPFADHEIVPLRAGETCQWRLK